MNKHNKNAKNDDYTMSAETIFFSFASMPFRYEFIYFYVACAIKPESCYYFLLPLLQWASFRGAPKERKQVKDKQQCL